MRLCAGEGKAMKFNKVIAIPAVALAAGLSLAACGSVNARRVLLPTRSQRPLHRSPPSRRPADAESVNAQAQVVRVDLGLPAAK